MQYNIYFRKDNWERFKDEEKKSELINTLLADHYSGRLLKDQLRTIPPVIVDSPHVTKKTPGLGEVIPYIGKEFKPCKHGYDPTFCKYAKGGKPCKV